MGLPEVMWREYQRRDRIERTMREARPPHPASRRGMGLDRPGVMGVANAAPPPTNELLVEEYFNSLPLENRGIDGTNFIWDNIAPFGRNAMGGYEVAWPGALNALAESASVPGRLWQGEQMTPDQMQAAAFDLAGIGMSGSLIGAPAGALGSGPVRNALGDAAGTVDDVAKVAGRLVDDLPMDEASRMARADELFPLDVYHGTPYAFDEFETGDLGYHFGTPEQANKRLREVMKYARPDAAANVIPARINIRNPLQMRDAGEWKNPRAVAEALLETPVGKKNSDVLQEIIDEADGISSQFESASDWFDSPEAGGLLDEMRSMIAAEGFDGVRYLNEVENAFGNVANLTPEASAQVARLRQQYEDIASAVAARRGPVPSDPTQIDAWLAAKPIPTPEEAARMDAITAEVERVRDAGAGDPNSYIVFDPANIRSRFAKFDPRNINSRDLLAGGAGGAIALGLLSGNEAEAGQ